MWIANSKVRSKKASDPEFMPFPEEFNQKDDPVNSNPLGNKALVLQFVKSPSSVNPYMTKQEDIYLQGEDRIFLNIGHNRQSHKGQPNRKSSLRSHTLLFGEESTDGNLSLVSSSSKQWMTIAIPHNYIGSSWPIRVSYKNTPPCKLS